MVDGSGEAHAHLLILMHNHSAEIVCLKACLLPGESIKTPSV